MVRIPTLCRRAAVLVAVTFRPFLKPTFTARPAGDFSSQRRLSSERRLSSQPGMFDESEGTGFSGFGFAGLYDGGVTRQLKVPVAILAGFLGAGKTTLVRHILQNREGMKVGVVVNDVAEANVDSVMLNFEEADGIVGLQNGCACCSGRDDLFARLDELVQSTGSGRAQSRPFDHIIVELSGVAEPENIARELEAMARRNEPVMKRIFLAGIIAVVDASTFWDIYNSPDAGSESRLPLSVLLVSQLESADTVIINKLDLVTPAELQRLLALLQHLCPRARFFQTTGGALPLRTLLSAQPVEIEMPAYVPSLPIRHSLAVSCAAAAAELADDDSGHGHSHSGGVPEQHARFGLASFVYRRQDRPFNAERLAAVVRQLPVLAADFDFPLASGPLQPTEAFHGVLRSKGFVKLMGEDKDLFYWSHAGRRVHLARVSETKKGGSFAVPTGQELVFIGSDLNKASIIRLLDSCLESDARL